MRRRAVLSRSQDLSILGKHANTNAMGTARCMASTSRATKRPRFTRVGVVMPYSLRK